MGAGETAFGPFVLDRSRMALLQAGKTVAVGQRGLALLSVLADHDDVVSKSDLMQAGWPGTIVEEGNLTVQIAALRKALGARDDGQEWIVTVPRVGYRLLRGEGPSEGEVRSPLPSLAVLPFQNLSGDPEQDYFADGVVEDIITALSRFKSFAVVARNSSFAYRGRAVDVRTAANEMGVRYVLEGSVRRAGSRLRVTAQLVEGASGAHIWANSYDGAVDDVFTMQDRITEQVAAIVHPKIERAEIERSRRKRPERLDAYDLYLQGSIKHASRHLSEDVEACRLLERSVELDPHFAPALATFASALSMQVSMGWKPLGHDDGARAAEYARRAIREGSDDGVVLARSAVALMHTGTDYQHAVELVRTAMQINANDAVVLAFASIVELHCGDVQRSLALSHRAIELMPTDPGAHWALTAISHAHMALGQFEEAIRWAERSRAINPEYDPTFWMLIAGNAQLGRMDEAREGLAAFLVTHPDLTVERLRAAQPSRYEDRMAAILSGLQMAGLPER